MNRRHFLKSVMLSGAAVIEPITRPLRSNIAHANTAVAYPLFVSVAAEGAWDPTEFCDPKGFPINRTYRAQDIKTVGPFRLAPLSAGAVHFFERYGQDLLVINGIQISTNNHDMGKRYAFSGGTRDNFPCLAALTAAAYGPRCGLSFVTGGGYDSTHGEVALTRVTQGALQALVNNAESKTFSSAQWDILRQAMDDRLERQRSAMHMPLVQQRMTLLQQARRTRQDYTAVKETIFALQRDVAEPTAPNRLLSPIQLGLAGYKNGLTASLHLNLPGFDTHHSHDELQYKYLDELFLGLDYLWRCATYLQIDRDILLYAASDFGRTPYYNAGEGKDHWPITSALVMGRGIDGNRVVGSTDDAFRPRKLDRHTLRPDDRGIIIQPENIHTLLRRKAGILQHHLAHKYPLEGTDIALD